MSLAAVILALVTLQRLAELVIAKRNTAALMARGAVEHAPGHYPAIVVMHGLWLAGLWLLAHDAAVSWPLVVVFALLQAARIWTIASLGDRWTTRIIVVPGAQPIRTGPYRYLSHPNYWIVIAEIAILPLAFGLPLFALAFSIANAILLTIRIRAENEALAGALEADRR
ncbi:MAG: hypothetical protein JJU21_09735 [Salinarimonas sp.]|nr:hypothetical protein [Salinarimonas sp.]